MLTILLVSVASTAAIRVSLVTQYYNQLAKSASEAGIAYAKACLAANNNVAKWSDENPLTPSTDCNGIQFVDYTCPEDTVDDRCILMKNDNVVSTYSVGAPQFDSDGNLSDATAVGVVKLLRTSNNVAWRQFKQTSKLNTDESQSQLAATGGTVTKSGLYTIHTFKKNGVFVSKVPMNVEVLVVAGGGGGGMDMGGGGGGGGVIYNSLFPVLAQSYSVTVGNGGAGAPAGGTNGQPSAHQFTISARNGENSQFSTLVAIGGGAGGSSNYAYTPGASGRAGGSGGGSSGYSDGPTRAGGAGTVGQGNNGGQGGGPYYSGGGGGAGGAGTNSPAQPNGGVGVQNAINGTNYYWGGGGGGASYTLATGGNGGAGGGGGGAVGITTGGSGINDGKPGGGGTLTTQTNTPGGDGGANTGGGGGGGSHYFANNKGGDGGSGIVIIRYLSTSSFLSGSGSGNWSKKAPVTITNFQPNFQTVLNVTYRSPMKADFSDLRFYDSVAGAELPYWIESYTASSTAKIWFKTSSGSNIDLYYGNPNALSVSNGDNTFMFFDDFNSTNSLTDKWTQTSGSSAFTKSSGILTITPAANDNYLTAKTSVGADQIVIESRMKSNHTTLTSHPGIEWHANLSTGTAHRNDHIYVRPHSYNLTGNVQAAYYSGALNTPTQSTGGLYNYNTWYDIKISLPNSSSAKYYRNDVNEFNIASQQYPTNTYVGVVAHGGNNVQWDNYRVRKYAATEPTSSLGTEVSI